MLLTLSKKFTTAFVTISIFCPFVKKMFVSLSKRAIVKDEIAGGFPDEMFDRSQIKIRIKNLIITEKLHAFFGQRGAVFCLAAAAVVVVAAAASRTGSRVMMMLAGWTSGIRTRFGRPHYLLVHVFDHFPVSLFETGSKFSQHNNAMSYS